METQKIPFIKYLIGLLLILAFSRVEAQNLIKNPGFEEVECGKTQPKGGIVVKSKTGEFCKVKFWEHPNQANTELVLSDTGNIAKTGNYCMGANLYGSGNRAIREYIMGTLTQPLIEGKTYIFKMSVKVSKRSTHVVTNLGAYFTPDKVNIGTTQQLPFRPQVTNKTAAKDYITSNPGIKKMDQLIEWNGETSYTIEGTFLANGNEKYVIIGNFDIDKNTQTAALFGNSTKQKSQSYYLIDDVSLEEDQSVPMTQMRKPVFSRKDLKIGYTLPLKDLNFDQNSSALKPDAIASLDKLVDFLNDNPSVQLEIGGHNGFIGKEPDQLAEERAKEVMHFLLRNGISEKRLTIKGYGTTKPVSFYATPEEQLKNRRVECKIIKL